MVIPTSSNGVSLWPIVSQDTSFPRLNSFMQLKWASGSIIQQYALLPQLAGARPRPDPSFEAIKTMRTGS